MSLIYTISYVSTDDGTSNQLSVEWTGEKYLATVTARSFTEVGNDLFVAVGGGESTTVAEKPAQRFRRDTFWRFADQMRDRWLSGEFAD